MPNKSRALHALSPTEAARESAAIGWMIQQRDPGFSNWDGFTTWLEEAPENSAAYDFVAAMDDILSDLASTPAPAPIPLPPIAANDDHIAADMPATDSRRRASRRWFGGAIAAALVAAIALPYAGGLFGGDIRRIETSAGQSKSITLADGSRIDLNGSSILELDDRRPRYAHLASGEAMFHIIHQKNSPFEVESGGARIIDLGTAFNVLRTDDATSISVSEGLVVFNPDSDNVRMQAGQAVKAADNRTTKPKAEPVDIATVGGWRNGLLVYNGAPLSVVIADLHRATGMDISVSADAADLPFRGALTIDPDGQRTIEDLATLSGTRMLKTGRGWMLSR